MQVSMRHSRLFKEDDDFWIEDLGSQKGTWLNGNKMKMQERHRVSPGDEIVIGEKGSPSSASSACTAVCGTRSRRPRAPWMVPRSPGPPSQFRGVSKSPTP
jgi:hypothetical protein